MMFRFWMRESLMRLQACKRESLISLQAWMREALMSVNARAHVCGCIYHSCSIVK